MTWSIVARDERTGRLGIAVATRFFAVGAMVPYVRTGVGAVASQAFINPHYGQQGLALLGTGATAADVVARLTEVDAGRHTASSTSWTAPAVSPPTPVPPASNGAAIGFRTAFPSPATCWRARPSSTRPCAPTETRRHSFRATLDPRDASRRSGRW